MLFFQEIKTAEPSNMRLLFFQEIKTVEPSGMLMFPQSQVNGDASSTVDTVQDKIVCFDSATYLNIHRVQEAIFGTTGITN